LIERSFRKLLLMAAHSYATQTLVLPDSQTP
jgi:hypothetical protein